MIGEDHVILGGSDIKTQMLQNIFENLSRRLLRFTRVPDEGAANCLFINGVIIRRSDLEFPNSSCVFQSLPTPQIQLTNVELSKVDGALTCCSVLLR